MIKNIFISVACNLIVEELKCLNSETLGIIFFTHIYIYVTGVYFQKIKNTYLFDLIITKGHNFIIRFDNDIKR